MSSNHLFLIDSGYFLAALLFVIGLHRMTSAKRMRSGLWCAGAGLVLALLATLIQAELSHNHLLMMIAVAVGGGLAWMHTRRSVMSQMPQFIALYNGLGGGAAAAVATVELLRIAQHNTSANALAVGSALIGSVAFAGSLTAFAKLEGHIVRRHRFANRQVAYIANIVLVLLLGLLLSTATTAHPVLLLIFLVLSLLFGVAMTLPIASADLPVLISLYNALTGLAVGFDGYVLDNPVMMVAGTLVFTAGMLLTRLMARTVNRSLSQMMYSGFGIMLDDRTELLAHDAVNRIEAFDAAVSLAFAQRVVIAPGYGMAVAQAQHKLRELTQLLEERGVQTSFVIHPVAGRMPGHMNVLLAEAGVPYEMIDDLADVNAAFARVDVVLVVGANDIANLSASTEADNPLYGMKMLEVGQAGSVIVLKRGDGLGYAGVANDMLQLPRCRVLYGDARDSVQQLILAIKSLD